MPDGIEKLMGRFRLRKAGDGFKTRLAQRMRQEMAAGLAPSAPPDRLALVNGILAMAVLLLLLPLFLLGSPPADLPGNAPCDTAITGILPGDIFPPAYCSAMTPARPNLLQLRQEWNDCFLPL
jgi:hypothetical protein